MPRHFKRAMQLITHDRESDSGAKGKRADIAKLSETYGSIVMRIPFSYPSINTGPLATKATQLASFANAHRMVGKSIRRGSSIQRPYTTNPNSNPAVDGRPDITIHFWALPQNLWVKGSNFSKMEAFGFFAFPR